MPWTAKDAKSHKKGLTDAQAKKWAKIANSALASCQAKNGTDCEARAIRIANSQVGKTAANDDQKSGEIIGNMSELIHWEQLDRKSYCVVPVIMAVEGVMNDLLYPAEELGKFPAAWNGRPVSVKHPRKDGKNISANTPEQDAKKKAGVIWNARYEDGKLKADIYIDPQKADEVDPEIMRKLNNNETMEVSTGLFIEIEEVDGVFNGKHYNGIARNHRPDHLALLLDGGAACSWEEGAGLPRVNAQKEKEPSNFARVRKWVMNLFKTHELNHNEIDSRLRAAILAKLSLAKNEYVWLKEVFDNYCIYEHEDEQGITRLYKQSYVIDNEDHVLLADEAIEVKEVTSYELVSPTPNQASNQKGLNMEDAEKKEAVEALISNDKSDYTEEDREMLTGLNEKVLTDLVGSLAANEEEKKDEEPKKEEDAKAPDNENTDDKTAPTGLTAEEVRNAVAKGIEEGLAKKIKQPIIERLKANDGCKVSEEGLAAMSQDDLEALEQSLTPGNYSGQGGPRDNDEEDQKIEPTPAMNWKEWRKKEGLPIEE